MYKTTTNPLSLGVFVKVSTAAGAAFGLLAGIYGFIASLFGATVFIEFFALPRLTGVLAGIAGMPLMPIAFALLGALTGLVLYWPARPFLRLFVAGRF